MARLPNPERTKENRIRRACDRRLLTLRKSAARDRAHVHYGQYQVLRLGKALKLWGREWNTLDIVEHWLQITAENPSQNEHKERIVK